METSEFETVYEETIEELAGVWYHPSLSLVCAVTETGLTKISNYETGQCIGFFDMFAASAPSMEHKLPKRLEIFKAIFVDREALLWNSETSDVATGLVEKFNNYEEPAILLIGKNGMLRWEYKTELWTFNDLVIESKSLPSAAVLYDESTIIVGYEDGTLRHFDCKKFTSESTIKDGHKSSICSLKVFSRDISSRPFVIAADKDGNTNCWNLESQSIAFKFGTAAKKNEKDKAKAKGIDTTIKGILYNQVYGFFLIYTGSKVSLWNSFTGFKMMEAALSEDVKQVKIDSMAPSGVSGGAGCCYIVTCQTKIYQVDLIASGHLEPEIQARMVKVSKQSEQPIQCQELSQSIEEILIHSGSFVRPALLCSTAKSRLLL